MNYPVGPHSSSMPVQSKPTKRFNAPSRSADSLPSRSINTPSLSLLLQLRLEVKNGRFSSSDLQVAYEKTLVVVAGTEFGASFELISVGKQLKEFAIKQKESSVFDLEEASSEINDLNDEYNSANEMRVSVEQKRNFIERIALAKPEEKGTVAKEIKQEIRAANKEAHEKEIARLNRKVERLTSEVKAHETRINTLDQQVKGFELKLGSRQNIQSSVSYSAQVSQLAEVKVNEAGKAINNSSVGPVATTSQEDKIENSTELRQEAMQAAGFTATVLAYELAKIKSQFLAALSFMITQTQKTIEHNDSVKASS